MLKEVTFPTHRRFKSHTQWEPIGFFSDCLCNATQFDLMLGFFSSTAINVLADGFASFLYNGGHMNFIVNDILTEQDRNAIANGKLDTPIPFFDIENIEKLKDTLSERDVHFFECLAWLIRNDRIKIKIVAPKEGIGISHTKTGIFSDGINNVGFDGSCNFSRSALIDNIESITVFCDWDGNTATATIDEIKNDFEDVFNGKDESIVFVPTDKVRTRISESFKNKELKDLLEDEYRIIQKDIANESLPKNIIKALNRAKNKVEEEIEKLKIKKEETPDIELGKPCFPYSSGPRDYQKQAFENWKANKQKGLFAMATGTGKTITSLNCLLEIYKKLGYYKAIILVPTITLVEQWEKECKKFNFTNIIKVCSKYNNWKSNIANLRILEIQKNKKIRSYIIISTYASFVRSNVFNELNRFPPEQLLLIADEAHNIGGGLMSLRLDDIKYQRRIGLTATPERQFDETGNCKLMGFFGCNGNYTFEYSMKQAIENGALCKYYYYPHLVSLTDSEMYDYIVISRKIVNLMDKKDGDSIDILKRLLLKRKRIIHKASNKLNTFRQILLQRIQETKSLKYSLIYVPEGNKPDDASADIFDQRDSLDIDDENEHIIDEYTAIVRDIDPHIVVRKFTSDSIDRDEMLRDFAEGKIDVLTSMKCLDEGVDVPRSEFAVFCASTGNPRQFIQRRGRVLRTHHDKKFAVIHDLIVLPQPNFDENCFNIEHNLVESEIRRVKDFALLSENSNNTFNVLEPILNQYKISIFNI